MPSPLRKSTSTAAGESKLDALNTYLLSAQCRSSLVLRVNINIQEQVYIYLMHVHARFPSHRQQKVLHSFTAHHPIEAVTTRAGVADRRPCNTLPVLERTALYSSSTAIRPAHAVDTRCCKEKNCSSEKDHNVKTCVRGPRPEWKKEGLLGQRTAKAEARAREGVSSVAACKVIVRVRGWQTFGAGAKNNGVFVCVSSLELYPVIHHLFIILGSYFEPRWTVPWGRGGRL